ncbi:MAG: LPS-assembly protein LptD, partial [Rhizobiaceae bacterium]
MSHKPSDLLCALVASCRRSRAPKNLAILLALTTVSPVIPTLVPNAAPAKAQEIAQPRPDAQLYLTADQLTYDNDNEVVTASGNVQMEYDGRNLVANQVSYDQKTRRVKAFGNVEIVEPDGNRIYAQEIDITDDFGLGFVNALRVETNQNTRFAAESAERLADQKTVFNQGIYTACEPCKERPDRPPLWQIKAEKVILDGVEKTVTYRHARFELFGAPIAYLPYFTHADPSVKRKSGFLVPTFGVNNRFGYWGRHTYFWATGDSHDLTLQARHYSKQGFLAHARWRHQLENGYYEFIGAGIDQRDPSAFNAGTNDSRVRERGMFGSTARFDINPRWSFGWDVLAQSDNNFSRTYEIDGYQLENFTNQIFLRGLHDKSFFDLASKRYLVQTNSLTRTANAFGFESQQPTVLPVWDYNYLTNEDTLGGEIKLDFNVTALTRNKLGFALGGPSGDSRTNGINGNTGRGSADLAWEKTLITDAGLSFTPSLSMRADWIYTDGFSLPTNPNNTGEVTNGNYGRFMPTAGLEVGYPVLATNEYSSHVVEPVA